MIPIKIFELIIQNYPKSLDCQINHRFYGGELFQQTRVNHLLIWLNRLSLQVVFITIL